MPEKDAWINCVIVRYIYGTLPTLDGQYDGNGDFDSQDAYQSPSANQLELVEPHFE